MNSADQVMAASALLKQLAWRHYTDAKSLNTRFGGLRTPELILLNEYLSPKWPP
jgi:hypothetical protein